MSTSGAPARDVFKAIVPSASEAEHAEWRRSDGAHVVRSQGRYWEQVRAGFYQPVSLLARLQAQDPVQPTLLCWGYRAALRDEEAGSANGSIPVHRLSELTDYSEQSLSSDRRWQLRRCLKRVHIAELKDSSALEEHGWDIVASSLRRTQHKALPTKDKYLQDVKRLVDPRRRLALAGWVGERLAGYLYGYAVDGVAYVEDLYIATDLLKTFVSLGLHFEFVLACQRSPGVREIVHGLHARENPGLNLFKDSLGFPVSHVPCKVRIYPPMRAFLRWRKPDSYYRLVGDRRQLAPAL